MLHRLLPLALPLVLAAGCATTGAVAPPAAPAPAAEAPAAAPAPAARTADDMAPLPLWLPARRAVDIGSQPYVRSGWAGSDSTYLDVAVRTFRPKSGRGPEVILAGAIHIARPDYYRSLQRIFDTASLVLFEGVGSHKDADAAPAPGAHGNTGYEEIAHVLGLVSQGEVITYGSHHFVNADLKLEDMQAMLAEESKQPGKSGREAKQALQQLNALSGVVSGSDPQMAMATTMIKSMPPMRAMMRLMLVEGADADLEKNAAISPRLQKSILDERNAKAMQVLGERMAKSPTMGRMAVFYGAAHLPGMEKILREQYGYVPVANEWLTAITVQPRREGLTPAKLQAMQKMFNMQGAGR